MKRQLMVPAACCAIAFASLYATLNIAKSVEDDSKTPGCTLNASSILPTSPATTAEAELALSSLRDTYVQRWRTWEESRYQVLSRAAPRQLAPTDVDFLVSPQSTAPNDSCLLAAFSIQQRGQTHKIPCVVDAATKQIRLFHDGNWLTEDQWLSTAPALPNETEKKTNNN